MASRHLLGQRHLTELGDTRVGDQVIRQQLCRRLQAQVLGAEDRQLGDQAELQPAGADVERLAALRVVEPGDVDLELYLPLRSEERRVGKECSTRWLQYQ